MIIRSHRNHTSKLMSTLTSLAFWRWLTSQQPSHSSLDASEPQLRCLALTPVPSANYSGSASCPLAVLSGRS